MSRSIVTRLALYIILSMLVLGGALAFLARRGVDELSRAMESTADRILDEDTRNKARNNEQTAQAYGKAMAGYLAWIALPPLWDYNYKTLSDYAAGMLTVPDVLAAVIYKEDGSIAAGEMMIGSKNGGNDSRVFTSDIVREGEKIGSVELVLSTAHLEHMRRKSEETRKEFFDSFKANTAATENSVMRRILLLSAAILAAILALITFSILKMVAPLRGMTRAIRRFSEAGSFLHSGRGASSGGSSDRKTPLLSGALEQLKNEIESAAAPKRKDELAILSSALVSMSELLRSRMRVQEAMSDIMNVAAISRTKDDLAWNFIRLVMEESNACMAAFYIRNEAEPGTLDLIASVGLPPDTVKSVAPSSLEGQFGAPVLANEVLLLDIPPARSPAFHTIAGRLLPAQLLTLPITVREEPIALFAIGSLTPFPEEVKHAFSIVREGLNAAMANLLAGERERELVQNLQAANQELAAQSEELEYQARELEKQNAELNVQRRKSEEASRLKTEFLSNMSHELRTPLNSILALSRVLRAEGEEHLTDEEREYLDIIERNGKNLLALINGILDLSKIEAGREDLRLKETQAGRLLLETAESMRPLAREKGISIDCDFPQDLPAVVTDEEKLRRIIINIAGNAVKFTETGGVRFCATVDGNAVLVAIEDTGIGIEADELPFIFDEFRQSDGSMARKFEGTGLGLAIAKKYAEILGIKISVASRPGSGTAFTLRIPLSPVLPGDAQPSGSEAETSADFAARRRKLHLHVVEDNPVAAMHIRRMLEPEGFRISTFPGGRESLDSMETDAPDGIVLDLIMPDMDGFEFLKELRRRKHDIPILVLTAKVLTHEDAKFLNENGIRFLALKGDVDPEDMVRKIWKMISQAAPPAKKRASGRELKGEQDTCDRR